MEKRPYRPHRSLFWPIILIGVGVIWLLGNIGAIAAFDLPVLFHLWPILLVFVGLDILAGRRSPLVGAVLGGLALALVVFFLVGGRQLGLSSNVQIKTEKFTAPVGQATSASVLLALSDSPTTISALTNSSNLIEADLTYIGSINFRATGTQRKVVSLARNEADFLLFSPLYWDASLNWKVYLNPRIPTDLNINGGSGESLVDLSRLELTSLKASMGSGASAFTVPAGGPAPRVQAMGGSGSMDWTIPSGAAVELHLSGGSGSINVHLPSAQPVRLEIREKASSGISFPSSWVQAPSPAGVQATWQTPGFTTGGRAIQIVVDEIGSGGIHIS